MNIKACFFLMIIVLSSMLSCKKQTYKTEEIQVEYSLIDKETPELSKPNISGFTTLNKWKLVFSDEFNDNKVDPSKWTVENSVRHRTDVSIYSNTDQVEEKNGNIYIYYSKASNINSKSYYAGRFNSKDKYATLYGFLEAKIHLVKPNGYQAAFWLMPYSGESMSNSNYHDGTAGDGAEIDIVEGNKLHSYSLGLHWDGYGVNHKGDGTTVRAKNMHDIDYHTFGLEWSKFFLKYYYDGQVVWQTSDPKAISHLAEYILFTGMCWGESDWVNGDVTKNTFIQNGGVDKAYIDYVRVYKYIP